MAFSVSPYLWRQSLFHVIAEGKGWQLVCNHVVLINVVNSHCLQTISSSM